MSVGIMARVFWTEIPDLPASKRNGTRYKVSGPTAKLALLAISDSADDFGENSCCGMDTLATKTSLSVRSIPRILRALEQNEYCAHRGVSKYGTGNYNVNLAKLGSPPAKRARIGRPKTTDSGRETTDSQRETPDSGRETTDSESPEPSLTVLNHPEPADAAEFGQIADYFQSNVCMLTPHLADQLEEAFAVYPKGWLRDAIDEAVSHSARHWAYVKACLDNWATNGRNRNGKKPKSAMPIQLSPEKAEAIRAQLRKTMVPQ